MINQNHHLGSQTQQNLWAKKSKKKDWYKLILWNKTINQDQ